MCGQNKPLLTCPCRCEQINVKGFPTKQLSPLEDSQLKLCMDFGGPCQQRDAKSDPLSVAENASLQELPYLLPDRIDVSFARPVKNGKQNVYLCDCRNLVNLCLTALSGE